RTEIGISGAQIQHDFAESERAEYRPMQQRERRNRQTSRDIGEQRVLDEMPKVKITRRRAKAPEQRADIKVLSKFENGNRAIHQRKRQPKHAGQNIPPLRLPLL